MARQDRVETPLATNLVVARARIDGRVNLAIEAPERIALAVGQAVEVAFEYTLSEASREHEACRLHLESSLDGKPPQPQEDAWGNRSRGPRALEGRLIQRHSMDQPGIHVLRFRAEASYGTPRKGVARARPGESHVVAGLIEVEVG